MSLAHQSSKKRSIEIQDLVFKPRGFIGGTFLGDLQAMQVDMALLSAGSKEPGAFERYSLENQLHPSLIHFCCTC